MIIINFEEEKKEITIGRGHGCDFKISEITVSRTHLTLKMSQGNSLLLKDRNSKFGTLIKTKSPR